MTKQTVQVFTFPKDVVEKANKDIYESNKEFSKNNIYDNLTDMQKEWVTVDDVAKLYHKTSKVCYEILFTDNCLGIESEYVDESQLVQHVDKMIRLIKRIKRGSEIKSYVDSPNFSRVREYNKLVSDNIKYEESIKGDLLKYHTDELKAIRGNARKKAVVNYVYSLFYLVDNREDFLKESNQETEERIKEVMVELSTVVNEIIQNK